MVPTEYFPQRREPGINIDTPTTDPDGYFADFIDWLRSLTTARNFVFHYRYHFTGTPTHCVDQTAPGFQSSSAYPILGADGVFRYLYRFMSFRIQDATRLRTIEPSGYASDLNGSIFDDPSAPQLVAVIKKGNSFYYVWRTAGGLADEIFAYPGSAGIFRIFYNNP